MNITELKDKEIQYAFSAEKSRITCQFLAAFKKILHSLQSSTVISKFFN